ncbi:MBL fold metallo-hydrolase [Rhizobium rhizosphaerae]|uniref:MBL fold metallo-hydrolase n=1 Tax=Xaviernesmea rhizosphaerae TaxID=1672749 RepID=A0A1Q9AC69_9HYPH|nr:MBL fold metallo-hydrolase [Xaviernesmea rhizosphaerae]
MARRRHGCVRSVTKSRFTVRFWGVRGSLPVSGAAFQTYGGNTICIEMRCGDHCLIFDAGSGLMPAGMALQAEGVSRFDLFFSHSHYDHILGLPFFPPIYDRQSCVTFWSGHLAGKMTTSAMIDEFMRPPWFPVSPDICCAALKTRDFQPGDTLSPVAGVTLKTGMLNHPGGAVGYRVDWDGRSVAMITDTEHEPDRLDPTVLALIEKTDLFIYDASYTEAEMPRYRGYGHSSWQQAVRLAKAAGAARVALIHHSPKRSDGELDAIHLSAQSEFPGAFVARDGQVLDL